MAKTLGQVVNAALKDIKEPEITAWESDNILQLALIEEVNNAVRDMCSRKKFPWAFHKYSFVTRPVIETEYAKVYFNTSYALLYNTTSTGTSQNGWGSVASSAGLWYNWIRLDGTDASLRISTVLTVGTPDIIATEFETSLSVGDIVTYKIITDEYVPYASQNPLDSVFQVTMSEANTYDYLAGGSTPTNELKFVSLHALISAAKGDVHRNESGKPQLVAQSGSDTSGRPIYKLWPYPDQEYTIDMYGIRSYTQQTDFADTLFDGMAPALAEDAVEFRVCARAQKWDRNYLEEQGWMRKYELALANLMAGPRTSVSHGMSINTYRRTYSGIRVESQNHFDIG